MKALLVASCLVLAAFVVAAVPQERAWSRFVVEHGCVVIERRPPNLQPMVIPMPQGNGYMAPVITYIDTGSQVLYRCSNGALYWR